MEGPWIEAPKTPESTSRPGPTVTLIHDDEVARSLGFKGGFVGGPVLMGVATPAIFASFGHEWYENGTYSVRWVRPVYAGDEIRVAWEEVKPDSGDSRKISFRLEKRDGEQTTFGWASIGEAGSELKPPWERGTATPAQSADDLAPELHVGDKQPPFEFCLSREDQIARLDKIRELDWWYRSVSPWGPPILHPSELGTLVLTGARQRTEPRPSRLPRTPMYAGFDVVFEGPMFVDRTYRSEPHLCDKGRTERSMFTVTEHRISDDRGKVVAIARGKGRYLLSHFDNERQGN